MKYLHIGSNHFDRKLLQPVSNHLLAKPRGGLWGSPTGKQYFTWTDWNKDSNFIENIDSLPRFEFELSKDARILTIDSKDSYDSMFLKYYTNSRMFLETSIDWKKVAQDYDAVEVYISRCSSLYWYLYGWDCDSIVVFNPDVVIESS